MPYFGDGSNLSNIGSLVPQVKEASSSGVSQTSSTSFQNKVTLSMTGVDANSNIFLFYRFEHQVTAGSNNRQVFTQVTGPSLQGGTQTHSTTGSYVGVSDFLLDTSSNTSRTFTIDFRKGNGSQAYIRNAILFAVELKVS